MTECDCAGDAFELLPGHATRTSPCSTSRPATALLERIKGDAERLPHRGRCSSSDADRRSQRRATRCCSAACRTSSSSRCATPSCSPACRPPAHQGPAGGDRRPGASGSRRCCFEDPLTGLSNRRFILTQLGRHGQRRPPPRPSADDRDRSTSTTSRPSTTRTGTPRATRVLAGVARALREHLRAEDQLGRLGGEEFLALLPDTDGDAAAARPRSPARQRRRGPASRSASAGPRWEGETPRSCCGAPTRRCTLPRPAGRDRVVGAPATLARRK